MKDIFLILSKVVFEATRGSGYLGDIAIDDVTMVDGACNQSPAGGMFVIKLTSSCISLIIACLQIF